MAMGFDPARIQYLDGRICVATGYGGSEILGVFREDW